MRDRLIGLLKNAPLLDILTDEEDWEISADYLLENGVIVPPCKVGDSIYRCGDPIKAIYEWEIEHIEISACEIVYIDDSDNEFTDEDIGKTVFLTREEAEQAVKGGVPE